MTNPESLLHEEIVAIKVGAVLDYVLGKVAAETRAALPKLDPLITASHLELRAGELIVAAIPLWWLDDDDDALLPDLDRATAQ